MRPIGLWLAMLFLIAGAVTAGFGGFKITASWYNEATAKPSGVFALQPGGSALVINNHQVDATRRVHLAVRLEQHEVDPLAADPDYSYPFSYQVADDQGNPLFEQNGVIAAGQGWTISRKEDLGGLPGNQPTDRQRRVVEHRLQLFQVPYPGLMNVSFTLGEEQQRAASAAAVNLLVYDGASTDVRGLIVGASLFAVGALVGLFGLILALSHALSGRAGQPLAAAATGGDGAGAQQSSGGAASGLSDDQIRIWGMWCHLSALAGLVVPFGNVIGPLVIWLVQRDKSPFIDDQGKEAINFQLSLLIYSAVCFLAILILVGLLLLIALSFGALALTIIASIQARQGVAYRYPLIVRFIR